MLQTLYKGKLNDWRMFKMTKIEEKIRRVSQGHDLLYLYKNPAYKAKFGVLSSWRDWFTLTVDQKSFNTTMTKVRISIAQKFSLTQKQ